FLLRLLESHTGIQTAVRFNPPLAAIFEFVASALEGVFHRGRYPKLHGPADKRSVKALGSYADDGVNHAVHALRLADDLRIAAEAFLPKLVTNHRHGVGVAAYVFIRFKSAPENGTYPQGVEIIR